MIIDLNEEEREFLEKVCKRIMILSTKVMDNPEFYKDIHAWAKDMGKISNILSKLEPIHDH